MDAQKSVETRIVKWVTALAALTVVAGACEKAGWGRIAGWLSAADPIAMFNRFTKWVVLGWMIFHTFSWLVVEGCRLYRSTRLKIERIFRQDVAEE